MNLKREIAMLIGTRGPGQAVMIGNQLKVRLLPPRSLDEMRTGITAPIAVNLLRKELLSVIPKEPRVAGHVAEKGPCPPPA